jgi:serine/threonine protein kinase
MKPERWQQLDKLFHAALEREPAERSAFLDQACASDQSLRKQVETLLAAHEEAGSFIERPAFEVEARSVADDQNELTAGQTIGHYQIISSLGVGGMGEVYLAKDMALGRKVALKLLPADFTRDTDRVRRFEQEARAASALNHTNVCVIYEIGGNDDGRHFIAMEYVEGTTLRQRMQKRVKLAEVVDIAVQMADALAAAHGSGIAHRDIKPENIMIRSDGLVKVLDFGLAKQTARPFITDIGASTRLLVQTDPGLVMGTVAYMSPEQARGLEVDARTDIWSLGVVLYEMVARHPPFVAPTPSDVIVSILDRDPPPLTLRSGQVPGELERIVRKALQKNREERYQVVKDMALDLKCLRRELEVKAERDRSESPEARAGAIIATSGTHAAAATATESATRTDEVGTEQATSSAQYLAAR